MQISARRARPAIVAAWLIAASLAPAVRGDDLTTLSGITYREVRVVRVEPDGIIWEHATGMCKVDFTDLPEPLRQTYHYDAKQAASYQAQQAAVSEQARQDQRKAETLRVQRFQQRQETAAVRMDTKPGEFAYRREHATEKAADAIDEQIATRKAALEKLTEDDGTIYDRRLWAIPRLITGCSSDGHAFDRPDVDSPEYQRSLRHAPADKAYYVDTDRAEAFARGKS